MIFNFIRNLEKNIYLVSVFVFIFTVLFLYLAPVLFGMVLIITVVPLFIGFFSFKDVLESLKDIVLALFIIGIISSPVVVGLAVEKYRINHPELIIDRNHPKIIEMTGEFKKGLGKNSSESISYVASEIENYVYGKMPYSYTHLFYPTTNNVINLMSSDCRGRALVGYAILKNLGYNVYITAGFAGGSHAWLRIYDENASSSKIQNSVSGGESDETDIKFYESMTVPHTKKVWVVFNEDDVYWDSSLDQLYTIFRYGFNMGNLTIAFSTILFFLWPISLIIICLFIFKGIKNFWSYFLALAGAVIVTLISGLWGIFALTILPLPIMIGSGLYIRWLNANFR